MHFRFLRSDEASPEDLARWLSEMTPEKRQGLERLPEASRLERICADGLARSMLSERTGIPAKDIYFSFGAEGKPYCTQTDLHFNISHSGGLVLCAVSDRPIGVDVEKNRPFKPSVLRVLSAQEQCFVNAFQDSALGEKAFFSLWTMREAIIKCDGGSVSEMRSITLDVSGGEPRYNRCGYFCGFLDAPLGYTAAFCENRAKI